MDIRNRNLYIDNSRSNDINKKLAVTRAYGSERKSRLTKTPDNITVSTRALERPIPPLPPPIIPTAKFIINWNMCNFVVTAYNPPENENDRPRINTFREDGNYVVYMSAGYMVWNPYTSSLDVATWGDRNSGTETIDIPLVEGFSLGLSAGIDLFTAISTLPIPTFTPPLTDWVVNDTENFGERKYQFIVNEAGTYTIDINYCVP